jgi:hypothetical protein
MTNDRSTLALLAGAALGLGIMYALDPVSGRRRRKQARERARALLRDLRVHAFRRARDVRHRVHGVVAELRASLREHEVGDDVLAARVRARIGHSAAHPSLISTQVHSGRVVLRGAAVAGEVGRLVGRVAAVRGVRAVDNRLAIYPSEQHIPGVSPV